MEKKVLKVCGEEAYLYNEAGDLLRIYKTVTLLERKLTAEEFETGNLEIHILAPVTIKGGTGMRILALVKGAEAYACEKGTYAHATADGARAYACAEWVGAYATVKGAEAYATADGAFAHATADGTRAYACANGSYADASEEWAEAYATADGARAYTCEKWARAYATVKGAFAYACEKWTYVYATADGAVAEVGSKAGIKVPAKWIYCSSQTCLSKRVLLQLVLRLMLLQKGLRHFLLVFCERSK